jgi:hypothetical protein
MSNLRCNNIGDLEVQELANALENNIVNLVFCSFILYVFLLFDIDTNDTRSWYECNWC